MLSAVADSPSAAGDAAPSVQWSWCKLSRLKETGSICSRPKVCVGVGHLLGECKVEFLIRQQSCPELN